MRELRNGALVIALFLFAMVPWRLSGKPGPGPMTLLALHALFWGLGLAGYAFLLGRLRFRVKSAEMPAFGLMLLGLGVTGSQLWIYGRLQETASTLIVSLASGVVLQRRSTLAVFQALLLTVWCTLSVHVGGWHQTATWLFDIILAGLFALLVQRLLIRWAEALVRRIERQSQLLDANTVLVGELREAVQNVQTLSGLIPICAHCKKIRNDGGYWEQVESFLNSRSEIQFTHGICPDCSEHMRAELKTLTQD
ncbi:MAG TPA: hypothetical protein VN436_02325 [Holophaga sp.]|nr:hypothetical protein [Holophaga sp.]